MKKTLLLMILCLTACKGYHLRFEKDGEQKAQALDTPKMNTDLAGVQFTFDDGPDLAKTPKVLDVLKKYNLQATFFVEGINLAGGSEQAKERRELLKRMVNEGHIIGNHTYDHKDLCRLSMEKAAWELDATTTLIHEAIDPSGTKKYPVILVRPPYGKKCKTLTTLLNTKHLIPWYWQIDPREWERDPKTHQFKTADQVLDGIMAQYHQLHDEQGMKHMTIILHDTKQVTVELLPKLLEKLSKQN